MEGTDRVEGAKSNEKEEVSEGAEYGKRTENIPKGVSGEENNDSGNVSPTSQK